MQALTRTMLRGRGFYIGEIFQAAARVSPSTSITLGRPLQMAPERGRRFTVQKMAELVDDLAARLWAAGVRPSERVAVHKSDTFDIALLACAAARVGAVPALLSPELDEDTVIALLNRLQRPWLITDLDKLQATSGRFATRDTARDVLLTTGEAGSGTTSLADLAGSPRVEPVFLHPEQPSLITHSSGTTGLPKLAVHCPRAGAHRLAPQKALARLTLGGEETAALCITFVHSRFYQGLAMFLELGNPLVVSGDAHPEEIAALLAETRPGYVETHPNTYIEWESLARDDRRPFADVRYFGATFDAMHPRTLRALLDASSRRRPGFVLAYGQSEIGPVAVRRFGRRTARDIDARCLGRPLPGITLRVVDDDGRRVRRGRTGHLEVRTDTRILTYLGEDERYARELRDGWWRLGDMGSLDRAGRLHLLDREVDRVATVESNLALEDLLLTRLDEVREVIIVAGGSGEPVPVVCTHGDVALDPRRWREAIAGLPRLNDPVVLPFAQLPRTSTRKVQRSQLAAAVTAAVGTRAAAPEEETPAAASSGPSVAEGAP